jgi:hypothetical protein
MQRTTVSGRRILLIDSDHERQRPWQFVRGVLRETGTPPHRLVLTERIQLCANRCSDSVRVNWIEPHVAEGARGGGIGCG